MQKHESGKGKAKKNEGIRSSLPVSSAEKKKFLKPDYDKSWAIVIGIDGYDNMKKLRNAVKDADSMAKLLIGELGFPKEQVMVVLDPPPTVPASYNLTGSKATKLVIEQLLSTDLPNLAGPDDRVIIFFAGHGERRQLLTGEEIGYLVPVDAIPGQWHTYILTDNFTQAGNLCQAKHVFYLLDACYSGLALTRDGVNLRSFETTMLTHRARMALTAGTAKQVVNDKGPEGHSPFTWFVLQGLRNEAARPGTSAITGSDLMLYVRHQVGQYFGFQQTPDFGKLPGHESGGDFVFRVPSISAEITRGQAYAALENGKLSLFRKLADQAFSEDATSIQAQYLRYRALLLDSRISEAIDVLDGLKQELLTSELAYQGLSSLTLWDIRDIYRKLCYWEAFLRIPLGSFPLAVSIFTGRDKDHCNPAVISRYAEADADVVNGDEVLRFEFTNQTQETIHVYWIGIDVDGHLITEHLLDGDAFYQGLAPGATMQSRPLFGFTGVEFFEVRLFASPTMVQDLLFPPTHESSPEPQNIQYSTQMTMTRFYIR